MKYALRSFRTDAQMDGLFEWPAEEQTSTLARPSIHAENEREKKMEAIQLAIGNELSWHDWHIHIYIYYRIFISGQSEMLHVNKTIFAG